MHVKLQKSTSFELAISFGGPSRDVAIKISVLVKFFWFIMNFVLGSSCRIVYTIRLCISFLRQGFSFGVLLLLDKSLTK